MAIGYTYTYTHMWIVLTVLHTFQIGVHKKLYAGYVLEVQKTVYSGTSLHVKDTLNRDTSLMRTLSAVPTI